MKFNKQHIFCETVGTISWLLMDFSWMSGYKIMSEVSGFVAIVFLISAFCFFKGRKVSERISYAATFLWAIMNFSWMESEYHHSSLCLSFAKFIFVIASIFVILIVILSRLEKGLPDIKRLKIK